METISKKKYLTFPRMLGYGSGDLGSNCFYQFVTSFALLYMTDAVGLNVGIVGTLMLAAKIFDGITDVIFGRLLDRTHSKMGKARPWLFWSAFPLAILEVLMFSVPGGLPDAAKYAYFFVMYAAANALAYTANNIAYATLTALITKNPSERVALGTFRYVFAAIGGVAVATFGLVLVDAFGGGLAGWRMAAIVMAAVQILFCMITTFSVKELPEEQTAEEQQAVSKENKMSLWQTLGLLLHNKYYLLTLAVYLLIIGSSAIQGSVGAYYCIYILGNAELLGVLSIANLMLIVGLVLNPMLVKRFGIYKVNLYSYIGVILFALITVPLGFSGSFTLLVAALAIRCVFQGPLEGSLNAIIADVAAYTKAKDGVSIEGSLYSCASVGVKVGAGLGTAICGWMLALGGYDGLAEAQTQGALNMITILTWAVPAVLAVVTFLCLRKLDVSEKVRAMEKTTEQEAA